MLRYFFTLIVCLFAKSINAYDWSSHSENISLGNLRIEYINDLTTNLKINYILPYELKDLAVRNINLSLYKNYTNLDISISNTGDEILSQYYIAILAGRQLSDNFFFRAGVIAYYESDLNKQNRKTLFPEISCTYNISDKIKLGSRVINPTSIILKKNNNADLHFMSFCLGLKLNPVSDFNIYSEIEKNQIEKIIVKAGTSYLINNSLKIMAGISGSPISYHFGTEFEKSKYSIGCSFIIHPVLGRTTSFGVKYNISKSYEK